MKRILQIGKPTHLKRKGFAYLGMCGTHTSVKETITDDITKVDCLRCRKTKVFKYKQRRLENET